MLKLTKRQIRKRLLIQETKQTLIFNRKSLKHGDKVTAEERSYRKWYY